MQAWKIDVFSVYSVRVPVALNYRLGLTDISDMKKTFSIHSLSYTALVILFFAVALDPGSVYAQGSITGEVRNLDLSIPGNGLISFFGFLENTDEEIRVDSSVGAGFDNGHWFDDFQNYLTEAAGQPFDYYFVNTVSAQGAHLEALISVGSFQQEDIQLTAVAWPGPPTSVAINNSGSGSLTVTWQAGSNLTCHVYRRDGMSNGSFFRIDNPAGDLLDRGVGGGQFTDASADTLSTYDYVLIAEDDAGNLSPHSLITTYSPAPSGCCVGIRGNVDGSSNDAIDILDLTSLVSFMFKGGAVPVCMPEANIGGSPNETVDITDLTYLVTYMFKGGPAPAACP